MRAELRRRRGRAHRRSEPAAEGGEVNDFIVAEIHKGWPSADTVLISQKFEHVIAVNQARGYRLHSFTHSSAIAPDQQAQSETIVAVFQRQEATT